jgi:hypothetical protein
MTRQGKVGAAMVVLLLLAAAPARGAEGAALLKDLTSVIALLGMPCGQVVQAQKRGDNDYLAVCRDGSRYRVFQNSQGRVTAEKQ